MRKDRNHLYFYLLIQIHDMNFKNSVFLCDGWCKGILLLEGCDFEALCELVKLIYSSSSLLNKFLWTIRLAGEDVIEAYINVNFSNWYIW